MVGFFPAVHLLQPLVLPGVKSPALEPVCALAADAGARPKLGSAAAVQLGTERSLYRSLRFILHARMFVPQKFRLRPESDWG